MPRALVFLLLVAVLALLLWWARAKPKATALRGSLSVVPKGSAFPPKGDSTMEFEKLDFQSDKDDALLTLNPNGPIDGTPAWSGTIAVLGGEPQDVGSLLEVEPGGMRAILRIPSGQTFEAHIEAKADVDNPATPDVESVAQEFHLAGAHSKASDLGGSVGTVTKGAGFPA